MPTLEQLLSAEGKRYDVYPDPKKANRPTVGIGHLVLPGDKLKLGDTIDEARLQAFFKKDTASAMSAARRQAGLAKVKDGQFVIYLAAVNFQLGAGWYRIHKRTWARIMKHDWEGAAIEAQKSAWYKQTPKRVRTFQKGLRALGTRAPAADDPPGS